MNMTSPKQKFKMNLQYSNKIKQEIDKYITGLDKEADMAASAKTTQELHNKYSDHSQELGGFEECICYRSKMVQKDTKHQLDM